MDNPEQTKVIDEAAQQRAQAMAAAFAFLHFATTNFAEKIAVLNFFVNKARCRRKKETRTAKRAKNEEGNDCIRTEVHVRQAEVSLIVPDEMAENILGADETRDIYFALRIPRFVLDRFNSRIAMPGEKR